MSRDVVKALATAIARNQAVVHLEIVEQKGSSPRRNAEMLIDDRGAIIAGTVGGGGVEKRAIEDALIALKRGENKLVHYALNLDEGDEKSLQMACGGDVKILIKPYAKTRRIVVVGAGHISLALSQLAKLIGYQYIVVDDRPDFANRSRFPDAVQIFDGAVKSSLEQLETHDSDAFVIVSHDHLHDGLALSILKDKPHFYLGMIGSKKKVNHVYQQLVDSGQKVDAAAVHAPIGLDIGGETPAEIALAIMAEIQSVWHGKVNNHLKIN